MTSEYFTIGSMAEMMQDPKLNDQIITQTMQKLAVPIRIAVHKNGGILQGLAKFVVDTVLGASVQDASGYFSDPPKTKIQ